ncbi:MAG: prepilin-type N-terminal cleavage/methylation domain-containing protein [Verrucomicrobiia bacterium]
MRNLKQQHGFTLIELMAVIAIIALLSAISLPALKSVTTVSGKKGAISTLLSGFSQARSLAISQGRPVYMVFADASAPEKYRHRSFAIYQQTDDGKSNIVAVSRWNFLPEGTALRNDAQSFLAQLKPLTFPCRAIFPAEALLI